jgi:hypothetical protein
MSFEMIWLPKGRRNSSVVKRTSRTRRPAIWIVGTYPDPTDGSSSAELRAGLL